MSETLERVAILASGDLASGGGGSTAEKVARDVLEEKVGFEIGVVICNNPRGTVGVYDKFDGLNKEFGLKGDDKIDVVTIGPSTHPDGKLKRGQTLSEAEAVCDTLEERDIGFVAMLGFMRIATGQYIDEWGWKKEYADTDRAHNGIYHPLARIWNNHPAILPFTADTHGHFAHKKAMELYKQGRITHSAMTYHLAEPGVDTGPIVHEVPVHITDEDDDDSLSDKVQAAEKAETAPALERHLVLRAQHVRNS